QAEDGIRDRNVTGVQTCALPICAVAAAVVCAKARFMCGSAGLFVAAMGQLCVGATLPPAVCHAAVAAHVAIQRAVASTWCGPLARSEEHTSELQSRFDLVCRLLLE